MKTAAKAAVFVLNIGFASQGVEECPPPHTHINTVFCVRGG